ncbi:zinc finger protein [Loa loa]|uniref:Zinc finger protein n=1 Tax=Loa loa TaxID=7209 RepID=A0A1S0TR95_LOALO|nr:zinc finger protein [Loa loa]EFO18467.1 zinc finger protein [Loa loa]
MAGRKLRRKKPQCNICQKEVINIKEHMITHTDEKPYVCPICNR